MNGKSISFSTFLHRLRESSGKTGQEAKIACDTYLNLQHDSLAKRREEYKTLVNSYYDIAGNFYEYYWGESWHLAPRAKNEAMENSLRRHEYWMARQLKLDANFRVLDVGCGIGGPMRAIAQLTGAHITGINNNASQVNRAIELNHATKLEGRCTVMKGDFMSMPFPDASFDAIYAIEALIHAPHLTQVYREIRRVLKPGGLFGSYEWCATPNFDAKNQWHQTLKKEIEIGNGIPNLNTTNAILEAIQEAGLILIDNQDRCILSEGDVPWWSSLRHEKFSMQTLWNSRLGHHFAHFAVRALESLRLLPAGTDVITRTLGQGGEALAAAAEAGIFTPAFFVLTQRSIIE